MRLRMRFYGPDVERVLAAGVNPIRWWIDQHGGHLQAGDVRIDTLPPLIDLDSTKVVIDALVPQGIDWTARDSLESLDRKTFEGILPSNLPVLRLGYRDTDKLVVVVSPDGELLKVSPQSTDKGRIKEFLTKAREG